MISYEAVILSFFQISLMNDTNRACMLDNIYHNNLKSL